MHSLWNWKTTRCTLTFAGPHCREEKTSAKFSFKLSMPVLESFFLIKLNELQLLSMCSWLSGGLMKVSRYWLLNPVKHGAATFSSYTVASACFIFAEWMSVGASAVMDGVKLKDPSGAQSVSNFKHSLHKQSRFGLGVMKQLIKGSKIVVRVELGSTGNICVATWYTVVATSTAIMDFITW